MYVYSVEGLGFRQKIRGGTKNQIWNTPVHTECTVQTKNVRTSGSVKTAIITVYTCIH